MRILLAEDNHTSRRIISQMLEKAHFDYDCAVDGAQAYGLLNAQAYDLALLDYNMPIMGASELIVHIRDQEASNGLPPMPIIIISADKDWPPPEDLLGCGASEILPKPFRPAQLYATIARWAIPSKS